MSKNKSFALLPQNLGKCQNSVYLMEGKEHQDLQWITFSPSFSFSFLFFAFFLTFEQWFHIHGLFKTLSERLTDTKLPLYLTLR